MTIINESRREADFEDKDDSRQSFISYNIVYSERFSDTISQLSAFKCFTVYPW